MANSSAPSQRSFSRSNNGHGGPPSSKPKPKQEVVKTWAFDSVGNRKYAVQIKKASNGNPCLKIVEGVPAANGTFHKFDITIWSEDFARLFATLDEVRAFMTANNIRTPEGHKWDPNRPKRPANRGRGQANSKPAYLRSAPS